MCRMVDESACQEHITVLKKTDEFFQAIHFFFTCITVQRTTWLWVREEGANGDTYRLEIP